MMNKMARLAYCGLYCPTCYKNTVSKAAKQMKDALENTYICGKENVVSDQFKEELNGFVQLKCSIYCREKEGKKDCLIRNCCLRRDIKGCWQCGEIKDCQKTNDRFRSLCLEIKDIGIENYIQKYDTL